MCGVLAACCGLAAQSVPTRPLPILARDVDKRPLPKAITAELSPAMRQKVQSLVDEASATETPEDKNRATPPSLNITVYRIPVAPPGHKLYLVEQSGELACSGTGVNCEEDVFDETPDGHHRRNHWPGAGHRRSPPPQPADAGHRRVRSARTLRHGHHRLSVEWFRMAPVSLQGNRSHERRSESGGDRRQALYVALLHPPCPRYHRLQRCCLSSRHG